jgi:hypothetical protein
MRMTEQILCLSFILKFSLQVSSLHHPACFAKEYYRALQAYSLACSLLSSYATNWPR